MEPNWLTDVGRLLFTGHVSSGWLLRVPLLAVIERDQEGHYFLSNEELGVYAVGITQEKALQDFKTTLIYNYRYLEAKAGEDPDLKGLFREYLKYLKRPDPLAIQLKMEKRDMADHYVLYQAIEDFSRQEFMMIPPSGESVIEEKIIPGWGENPPIYVRWYHRQFGQNTLHLLTYTHDELTQTQLNDILLQAARFAWGEEPISQ